MFTVRSGWQARPLGRGLALAVGLAAPPVRGQTPAAPVVALRPVHRDATVVPAHTGAAVTGGGDVLVTQPSADTLIVTLTGAVAAKGTPVIGSHAELTTEVDQEFEVVFPNGARPARLTVEARLNGLLRSKGKGVAELTGAAAGLSAGPETVATLSLGPRTASGQESLGVHIAEGPACVPVGPGCLKLHMSLRL